MKSIFFAFILLLLSFSSYSQQRIIAECTITYTISGLDSVSKDMQLALKGSSKTVYIKGNESRTNLVSPSFSQSVIYDKTEGEATILREFGTNKFITKLDNDKWKEQNKEFEGLTIENTDLHKKIAGYDCRQTFLHLKNGTTYTLFYTPSIIPSVKEFEYQFKNISGLVLEYEAVGRKGGKVIYTATKVNLSPVPNVVFNIPTSGYRVL